MKKHEWRERTEDGEVRLVTASRHAGKWQLQSRLKTETEWTKFPKISLEDLESLREIIWNKYQRSRVPHGHVLEIDKLIANAKNRWPEQAFRSHGLPILWLLGFYDNLSFSAQYFKGTDEQRVKKGLAINFKYTATCKYSHVACFAFDFDQYISNHHSTLLINMNEKETSMANNIVGQPVLGGIAFQTQPVPLYSTDPSQSGGSPFTFATLLACFNLKKIFSKKHNSAENLLNHSGSVVCTNTETDLVFIASNEHGTTRDLTKELIRFPISELVSCDFDNHPRSSEVKFQFKSSPEFSLYFIGQQSDAVEFISTVTG